jgi:hypothetical protein
MKSGVSQGPTAGSIVIFGQLAAKTMKSGVSRGSTPGPFLLNIFVNDIRTSLHNFSYQLFENDINIRRSIKNIEDFKLLNCDIDAIET